MCDQRRCLWTPQGSSSLDPFARFSCARFHAVSACLCRDFAPAGATRGQWKQTKSAVALWTASRPHLSLLSAIAAFLVGVPFVPYAALSTNKHETPKVAAPKVSKGRSQTSPVFIALWSPPQRRNPCKQKAILGEKSVFSPILRLHQRHRPQNAILIRVQTQRRIAPPRIIIRLPRA